MPDVYTQYNRWEVAESAAATFTSSSAILTGASVGARQGIEVHSVCGQLTLPEDSPAAGAVESVEGCLTTRDGLTAMPNVDDEFVIHDIMTLFKAGVAVYLPLLFSTSVIMPPWIDFRNPLLLAHTKLYAYVHSTNSSAAATYRGFYLYNYVDISGDLSIEALETFR